jgi:hypothetical protein
MRSPEDFPADIRKAAFAVVARGYDEGLVEVVCRALMERDRAATERAAKTVEHRIGLAKTLAPEAVWAVFEAMPDAIRSQP